MIASAPPTWRERTSKKERLYLFLRQMPTAADADLIELVPLSVEAGVTTESANN